MAYADDMAQIQRRRMLAQALIQQGAQPQGQQAGRFFVAPNALSTLSSLGSIAGGALLDRRGAKEEKSATDAERKRLADALRGLMGGGPLEEVERAPGVISERGATGSPAASSAPDPRRAAAMAVLQGLPVEQMQGLVGQQAVANLFPKPKELKNVDLGNEVGFVDESGDVVRRVAKGAAPQGQTDDQREYAAAKAQGFSGSLQDWIVSGKKAGATTLNVNTKGAGALAEGLGGERSKAINALYSQAQAAPLTIERADRIKQLLQTVPYTGAAAEWKLAIGKAAKAAGFDYGGDDVSNTEMLARELGQNVLDSVKTSGLAGSQGLTEGERKFLLQIVGGTIALDDKTLARVADLNQRMARRTMETWNAEAGRLEAANPGLLRTYGMTPIDMPAGTPAAGAKPKLTQNPDGSYTFSQ